MPCTCCSAACSSIFVPGVIGLRWLSLMAGMVSIAVITVSRTAFSTMRPSPLPPLFSRPLLQPSCIPFGRPYTLATCFRPPVSLFWLEVAGNPTWSPDAHRAQPRGGAPLILFRTPGDPDHPPPQAISSGAAGSSADRHLHRLSVGAMAGPPPPLSGKSSAAPDHAHLTRLRKSLLTTLHGPLAQSLSVCSSYPPVLLAVSCPSHPAVACSPIAVKPARWPQSLLWIGISYSRCFDGLLGDGAIKFVHIMHVAFRLHLAPGVALVQRLAL